MQYERFVLGPLENNCYLLHANDKALLVDASGGESGARKIQNYLEANKLELSDIYITHGHFDHIDAAVKLAELSDCKVYLRNSDTFLWQHMYPDVKHSSLEKTKIKLAGYEVNAISTPGHTPGSTCYYAPQLGVVFTGDTLFAGGPGATRWEYSNIRTIIQSITENLFTLPEETVVLPGHGQESTIQKEKAMIEKIRERIEKDN